MTKQEITGRDLIIYILSNNLEDKPLFDGNRLLGFITLEEAAARYNVGTITMEYWFKLGIVQGIKIGGIIYILDNTKKEKVMR